MLPNYDARLPMLTAPVASEALKNLSLRSMLTAEMLILDTTRPQPDRRVSAPDIDYL